ncbi:MAG: LuxR C-terminal-related transcriptional regulator [Polyangiaceae bacterium]
MRDIISVVEAAYSADGTDAEWLGGLLAMAQPWLDGGLGVAAFLYDASAAGTPKIWAPVALGSPHSALFPDMLPIAFAAAPASVTTKFFGQPAPISTTSVELGLGARIAQFPMYRDVLATFGVADSVTICASDPSGVGCFLCGPRATQSEPSRADRRLWNRLAAHIAAGARLRRAPPKVEAVLAPSGKIEHAEEGAKTADAIDALKRSVQAVERARGRMREDDPDAALDVWRGLVSGRWSLVDQFDHDGRRYIVAQENEPSTRMTRALSDRERQVMGYAARGWANKTIGYHLGLSVSTVATHLAAAARKLGADSRVEAVRAFRVHEEPGDA